MWNGLVELGFKGEPAVAMVMASGDNHQESVEAKGFPLWNVDVQVLVDFKGDRTKKPQPGGTYLVGDHPLFGFESELTLKTNNFAYQNGSTEIQMLVFFFSSEWVLFLS